MATHKYLGKVAHEPGTAAGESATKGQVDTAEANAKARANHTGTQPASTISDFSTAVQSVVDTYLDVTGAPAALNTLNEIAAALQDSPTSLSDALTEISNQDTRIDALEAASGGAPTSYTLAAGTSSVVTHNKNRRVGVTVVEISTGQIVYPVITGNGVGNTVTVDFGTTSIGANSHVALIF